MDYQTVANFAESWGLAFLMVMFAIAVLYALWPSNKDKFDKAAQLPLQDDVENTP
jgi:cytochrome c oxidase cbb3-type subunit 4